MCTVVFWQVDMRWISTEVVSCARLGKWRAVVGGMEDENSEEPEANPMDGGDEGGACGLGKEHRRPGQIGVGV